jgi:hypothetical protein
MHASDILKMSLDILWFDGLKLLCIHQVAQSIISKVESPSLILIENKGGQSE